MRSHRKTLTYLLKVNGAEFAASLTATGIHMRYGITRCYLPPSRADIIKLVLYSATVEGCKAELAYKTQLTQTKQ